jgi:hypothetical protein
MDGFLFVLTLLAALGCGMMAGVSFAFSAFVMKALGRPPYVRHPQPVRPALQRRCSYPPGRQQKATVADNQRERTTFEYLEGLQQ